MLRSLYCCLLGSRFVFFLFHAVSTPIIWFCPFLFFVETKTFYSYLSLMENNVGLLGLWALESLSLIVFQLIPAGLAHWAFFIFLISLGPSKAPHPFFFVFWSGLSHHGYLFHIAHGSMWSIPCSYGYFFFLGLWGITPLFICYFLIFPFSFLTWFWYLYPFYQISDWHKIWHVYVAMLMIFCEVVSLDYNKFL